MKDGLHRTRLTRPWRARLLALATLASGVLIAGCGASATSPTGTTVAGATTARAGAATTAASSARNGGQTTSSRSNTASGSGPLAFARCMRANGVPNFPDPKPGGGFDLSAAAGLDPATPAFRAAQSKCQKLMAGGAVGGPLIPGATTHPTAQTLAKLVRIAQCMRRHGILNFPDPRTSIPPNPASLGIGEVTDFDGVILLFPTTMNLQAPAYRQALTACGAPPLGLPH